MSISTRTGNWKFLKISKFVLISKKISSSLVEFVLNFLSLLQLLLWNTDTWFALFFQDCEFRTRSLLVRQRVTFSVELFWTSFLQPVRLFALIFCCHLLIKRGRKIYKRPALWRLFQIIVFYYPDQHLQLKNFPWYKSLIKGQSVIFINHWRS